MAVRIVPASVATASATSLPLLAEFREKLCEPACVKSLIDPTITVSYTYDTPTLVDSTVFIPVKAIITIISPKCKCGASKELCNEGNKMNTEIFVETFNVAFNGQTVAPASVTITSNGMKYDQITNMCGCKCNGYTIEDSITVEIA